MKKSLIVIAFLMLFLLIPLVSATITVPTTAYFGFGTGVYINFNTQQTFDNIYRENNYWYFDGYGFQVQNANMTITNFFTNNQLIFTVSALSGTTSTTKVYVGDKGRPTSVSGATSWSYDDVTKIMTVIVLHSSPATVTLDWGVVVPPVPPIPPFIPGSTNKTYYFRSDSWTTNTVTAYGFDEVNGNSLGTITSSTSGSVPVYYGFRLWLVHSQGQTTEITNNVETLLSFSGNYSGTATGNWNCPETYMILGYDALEVTIYCKFGSSEWVAKASYITTVPIFTKLLLGQTWTFHLKLTVNIGSTTTTTFKFGSNSDASYVTGIGMKNPLTQEIQGYYLSKGDLINFLFYGYYILMGQSLFFGIMLLIGCSTMYIRYRSFYPILLMFILFGGIGGLVWVFVPMPVTFVVWLFLLLSLASLIFRVVR